MTMESPPRSLRGLSTLAAAGLAAAALVACTDDPTLDTAAQELGEEISSLPTAGTCPTVPTDVNKSLVVTEPQTLALFSFARVMDTILASVKHDPTQTRTSFFQQWMGTYAPATCPGAGVDPNGYGIVCPRTREASLVASDPYDPAGPDFFKPVAVFNRFDLAPKDGSHCGEYRIVFAKKSLSILDRGFLIFEAVLPNPEPEKGLAACFPVAKFWQSLSAIGPVKRAAALEEFYFSGIKGFGPVVDAANYGLIARRGGTRLLGYGDATRPGQVRTNMFIDAAPLFQWNLREFKLDLDCTLSPITAEDDDGATVIRPLPANCKLRFEPFTDANNPANELFASTHANAPAFQTDFLGKDVQTLAATGGSLACGGTANLIGMATGDDFNEFESISSTPPGGTFATLYDSWATTAFRGAVTTKLGTLASPLTAKNVFDRATTQTCAGCHAVSVGQNLGPAASPVIWPASNDFTHVDENSVLSPALTGTFLPFRKCVLDDFIDRICNARDLGADDGRTIGGQAVGAAN